MSNYNYVFLPQMSFPTLYYFTLPSDSFIEQANISVTTLPHSRKPPGLELSEEELLAAGYERKKKVWTSEEDQKLFQLVRVQNIPWRQIKDHMPDRTEKMCYSRYRRLLAQARQRWAPQDERKLKELVEARGKCWKDFVPLFPNKSWKNLRDKYVNFLSSAINRDDWSIDEDRKILELIGKYGTRWKKIQEQMVTRTDNQLKNRFYGRLKILLKRKARYRSKLTSQ